MTVLMSGTMWSKVNVSSDNRLLCGLLIKLVENIAAPDELRSLKMDKDDFPSISEWIENSSVISRKITNKIKCFLELKESVKMSVEKKGKKWGCKRRKLFPERKELLLTLTLYVGKYFLV